MSKESIEWTVPTYDPDGDKEYDMSQPATLTLKQEAGLRVILGKDNPDAPNILIEKGVDCWRIFIFPDADDPLCIAEIRSKVAVVMDERGKILIRREIER